MSKDDIYEGERRISIGPPSGRDTLHRTMCQKKKPKANKLECHNRYGMRSPS